MARADPPYSAIRNWSRPSETRKDPPGGSAHTKTNREKKYINTAGRHDQRTVVNAIPIRNRSMKRGGSVWKPKIPTHAKAKEYATVKKYGT